MNGQTLAVNDSWLSAPGNYNAALTTTGCNSNMLGGYQYPSYVYWTPPAARPIRLTMAEIERLRKLAKADEKVKAILAKFTSQIEIVVEFD